MTQYSKAFGPTDSAADTKTTVGAAASLRPKACTIKELRVAKGNVVDAKECAGFITIDAPGLDGPHSYAYGGGIGAAGGATAGGGTGPSEVIACSIPIDAGALVTVSVTDAEVAKDVTVSVGFDMGSGRNVYSYVLGGAGIDTTADTLLAMVDKATGVAVKMGRTGRIKEIRFVGSGVVDAKAGSGKLEFVLPVIKGPWEYAVGNGVGADLGAQPAFADLIDCNIPVTSNDVLVINLTTAEVMLSATCSFQVV